MKIVEKTESKGVSLRENASGTEFKCPECGTQLHLDHEPTTEDGFIWTANDEKVPADYYYAPCSGCGRQWVFEDGKNAWANWE
jgi:hypothetical protein